MTREIDGTLIVGVWLVVSFIIGSLMLSRVIGSLQRVTAVTALTPWQAERLHDGR